VHVDVVVAWVGADRGGQVGADRAAAGRVGAGHTVGVEVDDDVSCEGDVPGADVHVGGGRGLDVLPAEGPAEHGALECVGEEPVAVRIRGLGLLATAQRDRGRRGRCRQAECGGCENGGGCGDAGAY
jgi:hypothetical protein